jgi:CHAT domain-containing protein
MADVLSLVDEADRLVLIPAGTLGLLPLHAAWREDADAPTGRRHFCDELVVSYAPNARSVARGDGAGLDTLLAVADPAPLPAPLPALSFAAEEVAAAQAWYPEAMVAAGPQATLEHVTAALDDALVHHYACHGLIDLHEPRRSALVLADGRLTVQQLLDMRIRRSPHGRLAILTACETALAGTDLPDEVISLPAALLQAGMTGVVATQWAVTGLPAALLSARFYEHCRGDGWSVPAALAGAQRWVRDSTDGEKAAFLDPMDGTARLPAATRRSLWRVIAARDPGGRSMADLAGWAAYVYVGDPDQRC